MISLAIWCNEHLQISERLQMALTPRAILLTLKNLLLRITTNLHSKSCYFLY